MLQKMIFTSDFVSMLKSRKTQNEKLVPEKKEATSSFVHP